MAGLDAKITVERELRPCIVRIPRATRALRKNKEHVFVEEERAEQTFKALFHCWAHRSELVGESPCYGGHPAGQISSTFALVEYEDGTIKEVMVI